jgi:hypothetical protein
MKFAYLAAVSVAIIAQAASAQQATPKPMPLGGAPIANQAVTLKAVTGRSAKVAASVTLENGMVWSFNFSSNVAVNGATVAGVAVAPDKLTAGMSCVLNGTRNSRGNYIDTLAC